MPIARDRKLPHTRCWRCLGGGARGARHRNGGESRADQWWGQLPWLCTAGWSGEGRSDGGGGTARRGGEDGSMMPAVLDDSKRQSVSGPLEAALLTFYLIKHRSPQPWVTRFVIAQTHSHLFESLFQRESSLCSHSVSQLYPQLCRALSLSDSQPDRPIVYV